MAFPKPELIIPAGFLLVTGLVVGVVFLREFTDQRINGVKDLSLVPLYGVIPHIDEDSDGCPVLNRRSLNSPCCGGIYAASLDATVSTLCPH